MDDVEYSQIIKVAVEAKARLDARHVAIEDESGWKRSSPYFRDDPPRYADEQIVRDMRAVSRVI